MCTQCMEGLQTERIEGQGWWIIKDWRTSVIMALRI